VRTSALAAPVIDKIMATKQPRISFLISWLQLKNHPVWENAPFTLFVRTQDRSSLRY